MQDKNDTFSERQMLCQEDVESNHEYQPEHHQKRDVP